MEYKILCALQACEHEIVPSLSRLIKWHQSIGKEVEICWALLSSCNLCLLVEAKCSNVAVIVMNTVQAVKCSVGYFIEVVVMTKQAKQVLNVLDFQDFFTLPKCMFPSIIIFTSVKFSFFCNKQICVSVCACLSCHQCQGLCDLPYLPIPSL